MKKILIIVLLIAGLIPSCRKDDDLLFEKTADERLTETLAAYQTQLTGAQNGWRGSITTDSGKGPTYSFYFRFNDQNRVQMYSDFDSASANTLMESSYRLKALQQPSLIFDTYSYVHLLADPNPSVNGGGVGAGLNSDFEFAFDRSTTDTITLVGRFRGSKATLIRATKQEADAYTNKELGKALLFKNISRYQNYFLRTTISGTTYEISVNHTTRSITFRWLDAAGNLKSFTTSYYYSLNGITFTSPLVNGNASVTGFSNISWNANTATLSFTAGNSTTTVVGSGQPIKADVSAPKRWWDYAVTNGGYWITLEGFHVNGVDDAYKLASIPGYTGFTIYYPRYSSSGGVNFDLFSPITNASVEFGAAFRQPTFTTDGRAVFPILGTLGTVPTGATTPFTNMVTKMADPAGFYFVQIDNEGLVYDMVSAADGKAWIRWEW